MLATKDKVLPTQDRITELLGASSPAHRYDHASIRALLDSAAGQPEVQLKKDLWSKLLRTAFGDAFMDDDALFVNHTLLVITAEAIAYEIVGFDLTAEAITPASMITGGSFEESGVYGVVEEDFFDWVLAVPGGEDVVKTLMRRIGRFDWNSVEHDVLKVLYESVITARDRESLGEYYTPDWLAAEMVLDTVTAPVTDRVLDPSCGSGTFVFHALRAHVAAVEAGGASPGEAVNSASAHVLGLDIHPVAVTLARVTYLMALGTTRLSHPDRRPFSVPVFLGDALQWERSRDLFADDSELAITTEGDDLVTGGGGALFGDVLRFPREVWTNATKFDELVRYIGLKATTLKRLDGNTRKPVNTELNKFVADDAGRATLYTTFESWHRLHHSGRDHIWSYYVRNLVKPLWLTQLANQVDVLIGNPPWLRDSKMTPAMQERYKALAGPRNLLQGGLGASGRDLSTLFVTRAIELYLRDGGRFAFVMPYGVLSRRPHQGFRGARWGGDAAGELTVTFETPWDLLEAATGFPMTSCVVRGTSTGRQPVPATTRSLKTRRIGGTTEITWGDSFVTAIDATHNRSHYEQAFRQGAIVVPRFLFCVNEEDAGPLGLGAGRIRVRSARSSQEKEPWKSQTALTGVVEDKFIRPMHLGSTVAPFRMLPPWSIVLPATDQQQLTHDELAAHPDLSTWWQQVEDAWEVGRAKNETKPLRERVDYHAQLSAQFPLNMPTRVVYPKSGNVLCASIVRDPRVVIDHSLYWNAVPTAIEADYLQGMLNTPVLLERVKRYQTVGLFGARHFDKHVFRADFPEYDAGISDHGELAELAAQCEVTAAQVNLEEASTFQQMRRRIVTHLTETNLIGQLNTVAERILGPASA